ncbi:hypothetical protein Rhopal_005410-T1 [Rhodotorula paludigena]|uniref:Kinetochore protein SPC25 n=1 Tax=Rhodotorula paludigena TaxID=86838 RepID=A0AAV5GR52_9BASI|nr:hypothetical protein Rhopal_005410-T1 [Rhodotorula paludigena]
MSTAYAPRPSLAASAGPGTPRGAFTASGTPRSARRLVAATATGHTPLRASSLGPYPSTSSSAAAGAAPPPPTLAPLAPINARPYPDRPYADDDELRLVMDQDRDAVDTAAQLMATALAHHKKAVLEALEEISAERRKLEKMTRELGDAARDMVRTVQREKDETERARELEGEVTARGRALAVQVETAQAEVKEVLAKLEARRELKTKQRAAFAKQVSRNAPELAFFEHKLGLKIRGKARDVVQFKFHNLDPASFARTFSFDLDASKPTYTITALSPPSLLPSQTLAPLLSRLNSTRDLYAFVRAVRAAFVDEVRLEKRAFASEVERERERARMRERWEREGDE